MQKTGLRLLVIVVVSLGLELANGQNKCSYLEVPVRGYAPQRDRFCKPWLTLHAKLYERRWCLCKPGYIRNAWEECIEERQCGSCWYRDNMDFNQCSSACPVVCGKRVPTVCTDQCVIGCTCPPGFVLDPLRQKTCVPVRGCLPRCPRNSRFQICASTCAPTCLDPRPSGCEIRCHEGECVCLPGFYKTFSDGKEMCVRWNQCTARAE
ncbi:serine protease inhibitor swm-1-like [Dermacentor andersoni]|uniref:serine protease inhibitor swm-1-like n=1 Tax=Dermacentor andersoni TaxID=34620 RepID=UPI002155DDAA|nr:serine protease inhibitor swm-1-like [Dermacentor andersoni]